MWGSFAALYKPVLSKKPAKRVVVCASWDSKYSEGYVEYKSVFFFQFLLSISGEFALLNHYFSVNYASFRYDAHTVLTNSQLCNLQVLKMKYSTEKRSCQLAPETDVFKFY